MFNIGDKVNFDNGLVKGSNATIVSINKSEHLRQITGSDTRYIVEYNNTRHICRPDELSKI